jgi:hypothetical protein
MAFMLGREIIKPAMPQASRNYSFWAMLSRYLGLNAAAFTQLLPRVPARVPRMTNGITAGYTPKLNSAR